MGDGDERYRIELFTECDFVDEDAVLAFWEREDAVPLETARARLQELRFVALEGSEIAAVSTAYLEWSPQLMVDLWRYRTFVGRQHRQSGLAVTLAHHSYAYGEGRFLRGETHAPGVMLEVENEFLKAADLAVWDFGGPELIFIGENERGDHVRVHFYPGAEVPSPPG